MKLFELSLRRVVGIGLIGTRDGFLSFFRSGVKEGRR